MRCKGNSAQNYQLIERLKEAYQVMKANLDIVHGQLTDVSFLCMQLVAAFTLSAYGLVKTSYMLVCLHFLFYFILLFGFVLFCLSQCKVVISLENCSLI